MKHGTSSSCRLLSIEFLAFFVLFIALLVSRDIWDPDYFWHVATGEYIVTHGEIPRADFFSFSNEGKPWVPHEWLFQIILYLVESSTGGLGIKFLVSALTLFALFISYRAARIFSPTGWAPLVFAVIAFIPFIGFSTPRPHLASFVFFALFILVLLRYRYGVGRERTLVLLPVLMILWVNMHGGYVVGLALLGMFSLLETVQWGFSGGGSEAARRIRMLWLVFLATGLASVVNPNHVMHWIYPFQVMTMEASRSYISEWASPNFRDPKNMIYLLLLLGYFMLMAWGRRRPDAVEAMLPFFFGVASLVAVRHQPIAILAILPFIVLAWRELPWASLAARLERMKGAPLRVEGRELGRMECLLNGVMVVIVTMGAMVYYPLHQQQWLERRDLFAPFGAVEFIQSKGLSGRIYGTYHFGGYFIYKLYPAMKVFIDGRADMYGDAFIEEHRRIYAGDEGWDSAFDQWNVDVVLTGRDAPIRQLLLLRGDFVSVYEDDHNGVLVRRSLAVEKNLTTATMGTKR